MTSSLRLLITVVAAILPLRAQAFEGVLHMLMTMPTVPPVKTDVSIRANGDSRTDTFVPFLNQRVSFIQRGGGAVIELLHDTKRYTESQLLQSKATADVGAALRNLTVRELPAETVAGYVCRHVVLSGQASAPIEVWVTTAIAGGSGGSLTGMVGDSDGLMRALKSNGLDGFPLKVKMVEQGLPITMEALSVEPRAVDAALFAVPSGYAKVSESDAGIHELSGKELEMLKAFEKQLSTAAD